MFQQIVSHFAVVARFGQRASRARCLSLLALPLLVTTLFADTPARHRAVVAVAGSTAGAHGANFRTELQLSNPGNTAIGGTIVFHPQATSGTSNDPHVDFSLPPHATKSFADIVASLSATGLGSLDIYDNGSGLPKIVARAYDDGGANGTKGVGVPSFLERDALAPGQMQTLIAPAHLDRLRFNLGVRTLDAGATLRYVVYKADGSVRAIGAERTYAKNWFEQQPAVNVVGLQPEANESIGVVVTKGSAFLYATMTDNTTNDPSLQIAADTHTAVVAAPVSLNGAPGTPQTIRMHGISNEHLLFTIGAAAHGSISTPVRIDDQTIEVIYTPAAGYVSGDDTFNFTVDDENGGQSTAAATIHVGAGAHAPTTSDQTLSTPEDTPLAVVLTGADADGDALTFTITTNPIYGSVGTVQSTGPTSATVVFTPAPDFHGTDSFGFTVSDGHGGTATGTITINVLPMNDAPVAAADGYGAVEDTPLNVAAPGVLANDNDVDGDPIHTVLVANATNGTVVLNPDGSFTYTPNADYFGLDSFSYKANDNSDDSNVVTVTITVAAKNDAPSFTKGGDQTLLEDAGPQSIAGWATAISPGPANEASQVVHFNITNNTNSALFSAQPAVAANGTLTFTTAPNANGSATITLVAQDNGGTAIGGVDTSSPPQTFVITVTPVNDAPTFNVGATVTVNEDSGAYSATQATAITPGPADEASQTVAFTITNNTNPGLFSTLPSLASNGTLTFVTAPNANGTATITVTLQDNGGTANGGVDTSAPQSFNITLASIDDAPQANVDHYSVVRGGTLAIAAAAGVLSNDTDVDGPTLTANLIGNVTHGTLALNPDGSFTYTNDGSGALSDSFTYQATDGTITSPTTTVTITITQTNTAPVAVADAYNVVTSGTLTTTAANGVLTNDTDAENDPLTANLIANVTSGTLVLNGDGSFTYTNTTPAASDSFSYRANDGQANSNTVTVTITITATNNAPVANNDAYTLTKGGTLNVATAAGVLANDTDADGDALSASIVTNPTHGALTLNPDGALQYIHDNSASTTDSFTYRANDGQANSNTATVNLTIHAVNTPPAAVADGGYATNEDTILNIATPGVLGNDSDADGDLLTALIVTQPTNGTVVLNSDGSFVYNPAPNYFGADSFTYKANDGAADSNTVTVSITVNPVNDPPSFTKGGDQSVNEDSGAQSVPNWATAISPGPANEGAQTLTFNITNNSNSALFSAQPAVAANGTLTYTPAPNASGSATITLDLQDNGGTANGGIDTSAPQTFVINVTAINDAPSFTKGADQTVLEDSGAQSVVGWATAISAGPNEGTQTVHFNMVSSTNSALFSAQPAVAANGTLSYTPAANANGTATITLNIQDDGGTANGGVDTSANQTFVINVTAVNDAPSFTKGADETVNEDSGAHSVSSWATSISTGPADESGQTLTFNVTGNTTPALFSVAPAISSTGTLTYTLAANAFGSSTITITLQDNGGTANGGADTSAPQTFVINVTAVNDAPSFTKGADETVLEDSGPHSVVGWATAISAGPNEGSQTIHFNIVGNTTPGLFSVPPAVAANGTLTYTLAANANGSSTITLNIQDDGGTANGGVDQSANQTFVINVTAVNDAPSFTKGGDQTVNEDAGAQTVVGWATGLSVGPADESAQTLSFVIDSNTNAGLFSAQPAVAANGTLTYTPLANTSGTATITLHAHDTGGTANGGVDNSPTQSFVITVNAVNDAPSFTKGPDPTVNEDAAAQTVVGWATAISPGPNEGTQIVHFNIVSNTNGALFSAQPAVAANGTLTYTPAANANGTATITLNIQDDGGTANGGVDTSANQTFVITVNVVNDAPVFTIGSNQSVNEDATAQTVNGFYTGEGPGGGTDESGQTLTLTVTNNNNPLFSVQPAINQGTGALTYTPAANAAGIATVTVKLQDNGGTASGGVDTTTQTFTITLTGINDAPVFTLGANQTVNEDSGAANVAGFYTGQGPGGGADEAGQTFPLFSVSNDNNALFSAQPLINQGTGALTFTPAANAFGSATVTVTLQDSGGTANGGVDTTQKTFTITVSSVNDVPTFTKGANQLAPPSTVKTVPGWATGLSVGPANESSQTLSFIISGNTVPGIFSVAPAVDATGQLTFTTSATPGVSTITIAAHDDGGTANGGVDTSATQTFTITNDAPPTVVSTVPVNAAVGVDPAANLVITFSEQINTPLATAFSIECPSGTARTFTGPVMSGGGTIATLTPSPALPGESPCVLKIFASGITDTSSNQNMTADVTRSFTTGPKATDDALPENPLANNQMTSANVAVANGGPYSITTNDTTGGSTTIDQVMAITTVVTNTITATTTNGGAVVVTVSGANMGRFVYTPAPGYSGADSFTYHLTDGGGPGSTGTVSFTVVGPPIWYVDASVGASGNGTISSPFKAISDIANGTANHPQINHVIFFYENAAAYNGTLTLLNGQKLVGQDSTSTLASIAGIATVPASAIALPTMNTGGNATTLTSGATTVTLGSGNTLNGLTIGSSTKKIVGNGFGSLIVADTILSGAGKALDLTTGTLSGAFTSVATTSSADQGISLAGVGSSGTFNFGSTTVSGSPTQGILIGTSTGDLSFGNTSVTGGSDAISLQNNSAGTRTFGTITTSGNSAAGFLHGAGGGAVTVTGTATFTNPGGTGIDIQSSTTAIDFQSSVTVNKGATAGVGVNLGGAASGNSGNVTFNSLAITTSNGAALVGTNNTGSVTVTNNTGTISATGGAAISISKTAAPFSNVTLNLGSVTASGAAANGVALTNVSGSVTIAGGSLNVTGGATVLVSGGTVSVTDAGTIAQGTAQPAVSITNGHATGTLTFNGNVAGSVDGADLFFDNADGTYNFSATNAFTSGAGINITNGSGGTFSFSGNTSVTNGLVDATDNACFRVDASAPNVTYSGNLTKNATVIGRLVDIQGQTGGTITFQTGTLSATSTSGTSTGIGLDNADGTVNFNGTTTLNGGDAGVDIINGSGGTIVFSANTSINNPNGIAYNEDTSTATVTFGGPITKNNNANNAVNINAKTGGNTTFNGAITASTTTANAVDLTANTGSTVAFTAALGLTTSSGTAFNATGGGTVNVTNGGNTITVGAGGTGINWNGVTGSATETWSTITGSGSGIGMSVVSSGATNFTVGAVSTATGTAVAITTATGTFSFTKISAGTAAAGPTKAIQVSALTGSGSFTVVGSGGSGLCDATHIGGTDCAGGTIQRASARGAEFINVKSVSLNNMYFKSNSSTVAGSAVCKADVSTGPDTSCNGPIFLQTVGTSATLSKIFLDGSSEMGIVANGVNAFSLANSEITNVGSQLAVQHTALVLQNLSGTCSMTGNHIHDNDWGHSIFITIDTGVATVNFTNNTVDNVTIANPTASDGYQIQAYGTANVTTLVGPGGGTCKFQKLKGNAVSMGANGSATLVGTLDNCTVNLTSGTVFANSNTSTMTANVTNNTITNKENSDWVSAGNGSHGITIGKSTGASVGTFTGVVTGNHIMKAHCGGGCRGIDLNGFGRGLTTLTVTGNDIHHTDADGIYYSAGQATGNSNAVLTIQGNVVTDPDKNNSYAIGMEIATSVGDVVCLAANIGDMSPSHNVPANRNSVSNGSTGFNWVQYNPPPSGFPGSGPAVSGIIDTPGSTFKLFNYTGNTDALAEAWFVASNTGASSDSVGPYSGGTSCP